MRAHWKRCRCMSLAASQRAQQFEAPNSPTRRRNRNGGGGRATAPTGFALSATSSCRWCAVEGVGLEDLRSLADEGKKKVGLPASSDRRRHWRRQGRRRRRRHRRSCRALQRRRFGEKGRGSARRQGRRRAAGYGASRRSRRIESGCGACGDRGGVRRLIAPLKLDDHAVFGRLERHFARAAPACRCSYA